MARAKGWILTFCAVAACAVPPASVRRSWPTMGTYATVVAAGERDAAERAVREVRAVFDRVDETMSNWSPDSELSRLNRAASRGTYRIEDAGLAACVAIGLEGAARTGGTFDPTVGALVTAWGFRPYAPRVPGEDEIAGALARVGARHVHLDADTRAIRFDRDGLEIDLGGIAKGCALDAARREAAVGLSLAALDLDLGGQWAFLGGEPRTTGIADPEDRDRTIGEVVVEPGESIATSSNAVSGFEIDGKRYGHILDPRTGRPADSDVVQVTAIAPSATDVEILGKALFVAGSAGAPAILAKYPRARAILVVREGTAFSVLASAGLDSRSRFASDPRFGAPPRFTLPAATMPASP